MRAAILALLLTSPQAFATSYGKPERHDVFSRNRAFVLDVNPETRTHTVYDVRDRGKPLWSFSCGVSSASICTASIGPIGGISSLPMAGVGNNRSGGSLELFR